MAIRRGVRTICEEIRDSVERGEPWNLTFAPCAGMTREERKKLQDYLEYYFDLWAGSWILPRIEEIESKFPKRRRDT